MRGTARRAGLHPLLLRTGGAWASRITSSGPCGLRKGALTLQQKRDSTSVVASALIPWRVVSTMITHNVNMCTNWYTCVQIHQCIMKHVYMQQKIYEFRRVPALGFLFASDAQVLFALVPADSPYSLTGATEEDEDNEVRRAAAAPLPDPRPTPQPAPASWSGRWRPAKRRIDVRQCSQCRPCRSAEDTPGTSCPSWASINNFCSGSCCPLHAAPFPTASNTFQWFLVQNLPMGTRQSDSPGI